MNDRESAFQVSGPLMGNQPPLPPSWPGGLPHWQESRRPSWQLGWRPPQGWQRWLHRPEQSFFLDPARHQGIVLGLCEQGVDMSLLRLATNAARHSWKVICFDALGSETQAATFLAAMYRAGCPRTHVFPHEPYDGWRGTPQQVLARLLHQVSVFCEPSYQYITTVCLSAVLGGTKIASMDELRAAPRGPVAEETIRVASGVPTVSPLPANGPACRYRWSFRADSLACGAGDPPSKRRGATMPPGVTTVRLLAEGRTAEQGSGSRKPCDAQDVPPPR